MHILCFSPICHMLCGSQTWRFSTAFFLFTHTYCSHLFEQSSGVHVMLNLLWWRLFSKSMPSRITHPTCQSPVGLSDCIFQGKLFPNNRSPENENWKIQMIYSLSCYFKPVCCFSLENKRRHSVQLFSIQGLFYY